MRRFLLITFLILVTSAPKAFASQSIGDSLLAAGIERQYQGKGTDALELFKVALNAFQEANNNAGIADAMGNIGNLYADQNQYSHALEFYENAYILHEAMTNNKGIARVLTNIGNIYLESDSMDLCLFYFERALKLYQSIDAHQDIAHLKLNMGLAFERIGMKAEAKELYSEADSIAREFEIPFVIAKAQLQLGKWALKEEQFSLASKHLSAALFIANLSGLLEIKKQTAYYQYKLERRKNNLPEALHYFELHQMLTDSLKRNKTSQILQRLAFEQKMFADSTAIAQEQKLIAVRHQNEIEQNKKSRNAFASAGLIFLVLSGILYKSYQRSNRANKNLELEQSKNEALLLNILPAPVAEELKSKGKAKAKYFEEVTVLFTDFRGFTEMSQRLSPEDLVRDLHLCFSAFDKICKKYGIEKIKTIGDAYMAAGGLPSPNDTHASDVIEAALEMKSLVETGKNNKIAQGLPYFEIRIGVHTGPVVAGIVGLNKFQYDIWGETVNTASRLESSGEVGRVNISKTTFEQVKNHPDFHFDSRGKISAKGICEQEMFFVNSA